jgi:solute carrier family 6 GABA transporter-like protein 6/8/11/12/13
MFQFATVEVIITSLKDGFGDWIDKYLKRHEILVLIVCSVSFVVGVPFVFQVNHRRKIWGRGSML